LKDARVLAEIGVVVALGAVLSLIKVYEAPYGGSVTAGSMVPVLYLAVRRGPAVGVVAGLVHGLIQFLLEPYIFHPVQFLLDYPVAFGLLGLAGLLAARPMAGVFLGVCGRFVAHLLSGVVFFASYAPEGMNPWWYSTLYNGSYLLPELVISAVIVALVVKAMPRPQQPQRAA